MPSESILEVRPNDVRAGDSLLTSAPTVSWMHVDEAKPITSRATGEVVWIEFRGFEDSVNGDWWERVRLDRTVIVRRPAPSPSGAEEGRDWLADVIDVMLDDETCDCEGPRLDLTRCLICDRRFPSAGARKPGGEA